MADIKFKLSRKRHERMRINTESNGLAKSCMIVIPTVTKGGASFVFT